MKDPNDENKTEDIEEQEKSDDAQPMDEEGEQ